ncbi:MAG TPA: hypothetical protein ENK52_03555 [Saprospiraceae bacterium]|nr:hypothetical protein [Saprospiraceae bacterium]
MKRKKTYDVYYFIKGIFTFLLLFSLMAQPLVNSVLKNAKPKYELCDHLAELHAEKELTDLEEEDLLFFCFVKTPLQKSLHFKLLKLAFLKNIQGYIRDIPIPPPEFC